MIKAETAKYLTGKACWLLLILRQLLAMETIINTNN
jgi:hypothetical protein